MLMAVNIFKNVKEKISDVEREQAQSGLFPTAEQYVEETAYLVADGVCFSFSLEMRLGGTIVLLLQLCHKSALLLV